MITEGDNRMKNKLEDLNNHLFEQIERLNDEDLDDIQLSKEIKRADAMAKLATQIVNNAKTQVDAVKVVLEYTGEKKDLNLIPMVGYAEGNQK